MMVYAIASHSAPSVVGRSGIHSSERLSAVSLMRGSMTTMGMPLALACAR